MSKKYDLVRDKIPIPGGGFVEALRMALLDLSCFGDGRRLDLTGYPHDSEEAALVSDWAALGGDFGTAAHKVYSWVGVKGDGDGDGSPTGETEADLKE